jgi:hypothetical protein
MEKFMLKKVFLSLIFLWSFSAYGQILVDTTLVDRDLGIGGALSLSKIDYKTENDDIFTVKRKTLGLTLNHRLDQNISLLAQLGYNFESILEKTEYEGSGYMAGVGVNLRLYQGNRLSFLAYGLLNFISDHFTKPNYSTDFENIDIHLGGLMFIRASSLVGLYGGIDLIPYSEGTIGKKIKTNIKRDKAVNLKLGLEFTTPSVAIRPEITLIGEKTITVGATFFL